jgi:hypothetical protein
VGSRYRHRGYSHRSSYRRGYFHRRYSYHHRHRRWRSSYYGRYRRRSYVRSGRFGSGTGSAGSRVAMSPRGARGIVEGVQGTPTNGTLLVRMIAPSTNRFRYGATASRSGTLRRYQLNGTTRYQQITPAGTQGPALGFSNIQRGERVIVLTGGNSGTAAQKVEIFTGR